jgi:hypothetical protein
MVALKNTLPGEQEMDARQSHLRLLSFFTFIVAMVWPKHNLPRTVV